MKDERRPICEVVAESIERLIIDGVLKVGQPLPSERRLCEKLGFSRSALREGLTVLRGRGMDALLEDCEFDAQTGTGITPAALATRVLQPVGLSAWSDAQSATGTLKTALGSTGSSIVQDYCASAGLLPPRMLADGRVCLTATRRSGGTALQGGTVRERSVQALAGIGVLHAAGTTYENPAGGRETRWRSALGWPAAAEFARSMRTFPFLVQAPF